MTLKVSNRDVSGGAIVRVSASVAAPLAFSNISATPPASSACTVTVSGLRGSTDAFGAGLAIDTCGATVSIPMSVMLVCPATTVATLCAWTAPLCGNAVAVTVNSVGGISGKMKLPSLLSSR